MSNLFETWKVKSSSIGSDKLNVYFDVLAEVFSSIDTESARILEIGTQRGGNLIFLASQFPKGKIVGVDINPPLSALPEGIAFIEGDSEKSEVSNEVSKYGPYDLIIEDASHHQKSVLKNLELYGPMLKIGGSFMVEDMQYTYIPGFGRGIFGRKSISRKYLDTYYKELLFGRKSGQIIDCYYQARFDPFSLTLKRIQKPEIIRFDSQNKINREIDYPGKIKLFKKIVYSVFEKKSPFLIYILISALLRLYPSKRIKLLESVGRLR